MATYHLLRCRDGLSTADEDNSDEELEPQLGSAQRRASAAAAEFAASVGNERCSNGTGAQATPAPAPLPAPNRTSATAPTRTSATAPHQSNRTQQSNRTARSDTTRSVNHFRSSLGGLVRAYTDASEGTMTRAKWARAAVSHVLLLVERVISYVTAWAWTDVFFAGSVGSLLMDIPIGTGLTAAVVVCIVLGGGAFEISAQVEREVVESYFMANSASFFVGFAWWKVLRDLAAISGRAALPHDGIHLMVSLAVTDGASALLARVNEFAMREFWGAFCGNLVYGPLLSVLVIWAKHAALKELLETAEEEFSDGDVTIRGQMCASRERMMSVHCGDETLMNAKSHRLHRFSVAHGVQRRSSSYDSQGSHGSFGRRNSSYHDSASAMAHLPGSPRQML